MRPIEIEAWVLRIADEVARNQHVEDSAVELKSTWPKPAPAARQIAAHANAARGAQILWVIGVDESKGVLGAEPIELADWFTAVRAQFNNSVYPSVQDLNVRISDRTVVALLFDTDRAPYLVKNAVFGSTGGGSVEWEVPWREGRRTRTATRENWVRMLAPLVSMPEIECLDCTLSARDERRQDGSIERHWYLNGNLYMVPIAAEAVVFPFHRCSLAAKVGHGPPIATWYEFRLSPPRHRSFGSGGSISSSVDSLTVDGSSSEVVVVGPGRVNFQASAVDPRDPETHDSAASVVLTLHSIGASSPSVVAIKLGRAATDMDLKAKWVLVGETN